MISASSKRSGVICGISAYLIWGIAPIYFHALSHVPAGTILCHRIVWSVMLLTILCSAMGQWSDVWSHVRDRRTLIALICSTVLMAVNWLTFIWMITHGQVLQVSLGYFITPLLSALLGLTLMREKFRPVQWVSLGIAVLGVITYAIGRSEFPRLALLLAISFSFYAFFRKRSGTGPVAGLTVETWLLLPAALPYLLMHPMGATPEHPNTTYLLLSAGFVTTIPLLLFAAAAKRLPLTTLGFLQYVGPTCQFLLATTVYHEAFRASQAFSFVLIWIALALYSAEAWRMYRRGVESVEAVAGDLA